MAIIPEAIMAAVDGTSEDRWRLLRRVATDERAWVVLATVAAQGSAFLVGLLITRLHGPAALGLYAATLSTAACLAIPFTTMLQFNAAMLSESRPAAGERRRLLVAHLPAVLVLLAGGLAAFAVLAPQSGLPGLWGAGHELVWAAALCVLFQQLQTAVAQGLLQGIGEFVRPAQWRVAVALAVASIAVPTIAWAGLDGAYLVLALNSVIPTLMLSWLYLRGRDRSRPSPDTPGEAAPDRAPPSIGLVLRAHLASLSSVVAASSGALTSWLCAVYLVNRSQGAEGLGWVAIGLQWGTFVLVPVTSWGGVTLKRLLDARNSGRPSAVRRVMRVQIGQNAAVTAAVVTTVLIASPILAAMYRVPLGTLWPLLAVSGVYAVLAAVNNVFERMFYCVDRQATWMRLTLLSVLVQCVVTWLVIDESFLGVAVGLCAGSATLAVGSWWCARSLTAMFGESR